MFQLGDIIRATPEGTLEVRNHKLKIPTEAKVSYIHPEGRFYVLEFQFPSGISKETRLFTEQELEEGQAMGLFPKRKKPRGNSNYGCPRGFVMDEIGNLMDNYGSHPGDNDSDIDVALF